MLKRIENALSRVYPKATTFEFSRIRVIYFFYLAAMILTSAWIIFDSFSFPTKNNYLGELSCFGVVILGYYFILKGRFAASANMVFGWPFALYFLFISPEHAILPPGRSFLITQLFYFIGMVVLLVSSAGRGRLLLFQALVMAQLIFHLFLTDKLAYSFDLIWPNYAPSLNPLLVLLVMTGLVQLIFHVFHSLSGEKEKALSQVRRQINNTLFQYPDALIHLRFTRDEEEQRTGMVVERINPLFESYFEVKFVEVKGRTAATVFQKIFRDDVNWQEIFQNHKRGAQEIFVSHLNKWFEVTIIQIDNDEVLGLFKEITARKSSERELSVSRHRYKLLLETIPDIFFVIDKDGTYIDYVAKEEGLEISADEIIGSTIFEVGFSERMVRQVYHSIQTVIKFDAIESIEYALEVKGRGTCLFEMRMVKLSDISVMAISRDITKRKLTEQKLEEAKQKAEEADRLKSAFLQNISHEVRTPMNAVMGFSNMLIAEDMSKLERDRYLQLIVRNGQSLLRLINDMIKLSRIESGQVDVQKEFFMVNNLMIDLHRQFMYEKEQLGKKALRLNVSSGNDNPKFAIYTDGQKLRDIFESLIDNAVKFTNEGSIEFGYELEDSREITFYVKDTGMGIPSDKHAEIFRRFHQLDNSLTREYGGTGIGLSVAKDFAEKLGSELKVDSEPGKGSRFYFKLPIEAGEGFLRVV